MKELEQVEIERKRSFTRTLRERSTNFLGGGSEDESAVADTMEAMERPTQALVLRTLVPEENDGKVVRGPRPKYADFAPRPKWVPQPFSWKEWMEAVSARITGSAFAAHCRLHHVFICTFHPTTRWVFSLPSKIFVLQCTFFQAIFALSLAFHPAVAWISFKMAKRHAGESNWSPVPCACSSCINDEGVEAGVCFGQPQVNTCILVGLISAILARLWLNLWRGRTFESRCAALTTEEKEHFFVHKFYTAIQPWKFSPSQRGIGAFTVLLLETYVIGYSWFSFSTSSQMVETTFPTMVGKVLVEVPDAERPEFDAAAEAGMRFSFLFEGTARLFAVLLFYTLFFQALWEMFMIVVHVGLGRPDTQESWEWLEPRLWNLIHGLRWALVQVLKLILKILRIIFPCKLPTSRAGLKELGADLKKLIVRLFVGAWAIIWGLASALLSVPKQMKARHGSYRVRKVEVAARDLPDGDASPADESARRGPLGRLRALVKFPRRKARESG